MPPILESGTRLGKWLIQERIPRPWGDLLVADYDSVEGAHVLERLSASFIETQPDQAARFGQIAANWIAAAPHPNVLGAYGRMSQAGEGFLVVEHLPRTLADEIPGGRASLADRLRWAVQLCDGLQHLLASGLGGHGGLAPRRCRLTAEGNLRVGPGLADPDADFAAPECLADQSADVRSDVYSLGKILAVLLADSEAAPDVAGVIACCLERNPEARFDDFLDPRAALASLAERLTGQSLPTPSRTAMDWIERAQLQARLRLGADCGESFLRALRLDRRGVARELIINRRPRADLLQVLLVRTQSLSVLSDLVNEALDDPDEEVRWEAGSLLGEFPTPATGPIRFPKEASGYLSASAPASPGPSYSPPPSDRPPICCQTDVSFPGKVTLGKTYNLRVRLGPASARKAHEHDVEVTLATENPDTPIWIEVSVAAENFEIDSDCCARMLVSPTGHGAPINFRLRGVEVGPGRVILDFTQQGWPVGSVDLYPEIVAAEQKADSATPTAPPASARVELTGSPGEAPDVTLKVFEYSHQPGKLHFVLASTNPRLRDLPTLDGDLGTKDLRVEASGWVDSQLARLGALAERSPVHADEVERTLAGIGHTLFEQLLPAPLQATIWILYQRGMRTLLVLSDTPHIPWELVKPIRFDPVTRAVEAEAAFWGEQFAMTLWLRGRPPAARFRLDRVVAVAVNSDETREGAAESGSLAALQTGQDVAIVRGLRSLGTAVETVPARCAPFWETLERGGFDLLHLACHGQFGGGADASQMVLEDGPIRADELSPRLQSSLGVSAPLIFFNACQSGRLGFSLTRLGSWGADLLRLGCGGFIGSLWPVTDRAAVTFARNFYAAIATGIPLGEAMRRSRLEVRRQHPGDPTWLSYCCFGDPLARFACRLSGEPRNASPGAG